MVAANQTAAARKNSIGGLVGSSAPQARAMTAMAIAMTPCSECPTTPATVRRLVTMAWTHSAAPRANSTVTTTAGRGHGSSETVHRFGVSVAHVCQRIVARQAATVPRRSRSTAGRRLPSDQ